MEKNLKKETNNALKSEHLKSPFKPIFVCFGEKKSHLYYLDEKNISFKEKAKNSEVLDFYAKQNDLDENQIINAGENTYLISQINEKPKISFDYFDCTGVAVVGTDKFTHKNISFMTHQYPGSFLKKNKESFKKEFTEQLKNIKEKTIEGSIDIVIFGGNAFKFDRKKISIYKNSIKLLSGLVEKVFLFHPVISVGPKTIGGGEYILLDTAKKRLYIGRDDIPTVYKNRDPFLAKNVDKENFFKKR